MTGIELPLFVNHVVVFPDGDHGMRRKNGEYVPVIVPPGRKAAQTLRARLGLEGVACTKIESTTINPNTTALMTFPRL